MDPAEHRAAGWYADESNPLLQRWWNGISWGEQTRPVNPSAAPKTVPMSTPRPIDPYGPTASPSAPRTTRAPVRDGRFSNVNPTGYIGVVLGFVSLLFNFFCIPSILAIIFSVRGLRTARRLKASGRNVTGWNWCIAGLVLGIAETAIYLVTAVR
jgi:Protein of unknown function (DUF2510)